MPYLINMPQEQRAFVCETAAEVVRVCLSFLPANLIEQWMETATVADVLQDQRFGRVQIIALGRLTDASLQESIRIEKELLAEAAEQVDAVIKSVRERREGTQ